MLLLPIMLSQQAFALITRHLSWIVEVSSIDVDRVILISDKVWRSSTLLSSIILISEDYHLPIINHCDPWQNETTSDRHQFGHLWLHHSSITRSSILVLPQLSGFKSFRIQSYRFNFRRHDQTGEFCNGFVLKRSGFVTNPKTIFSGVVTHVADFQSVARARLGTTTTNQPIRQKLPSLQLTNQPSFC